MPDTSGGAGPLGEETRRLLAAVQDWAQRAMPAPPSGHPGPECQWCPLCQFASILRGEHPEIADRVVEAGTALTALVKSLGDAATHLATNVPPHGTNGHGAHRPSPTPRVQRIRLDDEPGSPDES